MLTYAGIAPKQVRRIYMHIYTYIYISIDKRGPRLACAIQHVSKSHSAKIGAGPAHKKKQSVFVLLYQ